MADKLAKLFGSQLKELRKAHKDTKEILARKLSEAGVPVTEEDVKDWEKGKQMPGRDIMSAICKLYECDYYRLFGVKNAEEFRALSVKLMLTPEEALAMQLTFNTLKM